MSSRLAGLTTRGGLVNLGFGACMQALAAVQAVIIGRLLGPEILGLYALATGGVIIGTTLKDFGISQKLVQERDTDLYTAYGVAFTLELALAGAAFLLVAGAVGPILALAYHRPILVPVVAALSLSVFTTAFLYLPASLPYREMNFVRRNTILAAGPVTTFAVTVPAAIEGLGIWSLVAGDLAGFIVAAAVVFLSGSVRPHVVFDRALMRKFVSFGGPLWGSGLLNTAAGWITTIVVSGALGVRAVGYFSLSQSWASQAVQVEGFLADTLFPALCSIQSSLERQRRAFVLTCRLSMGWAAPVGAGMMLFASPIVHILLGSRWIPTIFLLQAGGFAVMITSLAFSWTTFFAARGDTRPAFVGSVLSAAWLLVAFLPLTLVFGLHGVAGAIVLLTVGTYALRRHYLKKLFGNLHLISMVWREWLAAAAGAGIIGLCQLAGWRASGAWDLVGQALLFGVIALGSFGLLERRLLLDVLGSLRQGRVAPAAKPVDDRHADFVQGEGLPSRPLPGSVAAGRDMSFPLSVSADPDGRTAWVTTRDWPALGRMDIETRQCDWVELPPYPHVPSPDGDGGCWTALTRSSALAHVDRAGTVRLVELEETRELLVTALTDDAIWAVDAHLRRLWRVDRRTLSKQALSLDGLRRPDWVGSDRRGTMWVADTHSPALVVIDEATLERRLLVGPHPTRALLPDWSGRGMWLGSSNLPQVSLVDSDGQVRLAVELPGIPFGLSRIARGVMVATLKDRDSLAVIRPARREVFEVPLGEGSLPLGCAVSGSSVIAALGGISEIALLEIPEEMRSAATGRAALVG